MQANTNNVNKTWALLQTIGGKDEPNIGKCAVIKNTDQELLFHGESLLPPLTTVI